jgi:hypothetical protein
MPVTTVTRTLTKRELNKLKKKRESYRRKLIKKFRKERMK